MIKRILDNFKKVSDIFTEKDGKRVLWYEGDRLNLLKQHHDHEEYNDIEGIKKCLENPDIINLSRNKKSKILIYYRDRGNFLSKWHQVVIHVCKEWNNRGVDIKDKYAILITTQYLNSININEKQLWP